MTAQNVMCQNKRVAIKNTGKSIHNKDKTFAGYFIPRGIFVLIEQGPLCLKWSMEEWVFSNDGAKSVEG